MKNNKILKMLFIIIYAIIIINVLIGKSMAKYNYNTEFTAVKLYRNTIFNPIELTFSTKEYTNQDVVVYARADKKIKAINGFTWDEENKRYYKILKENEKR